MMLLEESARANPDARIRPLTHVSVDRAYQAESVGRNSLVTILIAIRRYCLFRDLKKGPLQLQEADF